MDLLVTFLFPFFFIIFFFYISTCLPVFKVIFYTSVYVSLSKLDGDGQNSSNVFKIAFESCYYEDEAN